MSKHSLANIGDPLAKQQVCPFGQVARKLLDTKFSMRQEQKAFELLQNVIEQLLLIMQCFRWGQTGKYHVVGKVSNLAYSVSAQHMCCLHLK